MNKIKKLFWVARTFKNPFVFLKTLYASGKGRAVLKMSSGLEIEVRRNRWDSAIVMEMFQECPYLDGVSLGAGSMVVDIGCYIGDFSLYVAKNFGARVIAFEPSHDNYEIARSNIDRNRLGQLVQLNQLALGDGEPVTLYVRRHGEETHVTFEPCPGAVPEQVASLGLKGALDMANGDVDLLKIDCEGFEYSIIENAAVEDFDRVKVIALEYHQIDGWQVKLDAMRKKLQQAGFTVSLHAPYLYCRR